MGACTSSSSKKKDQPKDNSDINVTGKPSNNENIEIDVVPGDIIPKDLIQRTLKKVDTEADDFLQDSPNVVPFFTRIWH